jgi:hypothetical protein
MKTVLQTFVVLFSLRKVVRAKLAQSSLISNSQNQQACSFSESSSRCYNYKMVHTKCRDKFYHYRTDDGSFGEVFSFVIL